MSADIRWMDWNNERVPECPREPGVPMQWARLLNGTVGWGCSCGTYLHIPREEPKTTLRIQEPEVVTGPRPPGISFCVVCGTEFVAQVGSRLFTDKEECHEKLIKDLVQAFGEHKKVVDEATGKAYRVPTREILERGLRQEDLPKFPEWTE